MAKTKSKSATYNPKNTWKYDLKKNGALYLIFLIPFTFLLIFKYIPMVGILMAFQDYKVAKGLFGSPWVGLDKFKELFAGAQFGYAFRNTVYMALLNLTLGFIIPVILGLLISQVRNKRTSRVVQTTTYMPYFVAPVVVCTLAKEFLKEGGAITMFLTMFGLPNQNWLAVNAIGLGPQGMGGNYSVMGVNIENTARHPSAIGVAVNVGCWSHRRGHIVFDKDLNYTVDTHTGFVYEEK